MRPLLLTAFLHGVRSHVPRAAGFLLNLPLRISFPPLLALRTSRLSSSSGCATADLLSYAFFNVSTTLIVLFVLPLIILFSFVVPHFHLSLSSLFLFLFFLACLGRISAAHTTAGLTTASSELPKLWSRMSYHHHVLHLPPDFQPVTPSVQIFVLNRRRA